MGFGIKGVLNRYGIHTGAAATRPLHRASALLAHPGNHNISGQAEEWLFVAFDIGFYQQVLEMSVGRFCQP